MSEMAPAPVGVVAHYNLLERLGPAGPRSSPWNSGCAIWSRRRPDGGATRPGNAPSTNGIIDHWPNNSAITGCASARR